jgi:heme/copper-type cytochrome/quinol oxidase subunit 3
MSTGVLQQKPGAGGTLGRGPDDPAPGDGGRGDGVPWILGDTALFGLLAFLGTVSMLFIGFTSAYMIRRTSVDWRPLRAPGILWANTAALAASSLALQVARRRLREWDLRSVLPWVAATGALGVLFLAGQVLAWRSLAAQGVFLATNPHSSFFYMLTGLHGLHLLGGLAWFAVVLVRVRRMDYTPGEDLISLLASANIDGEQLTSAELASFFILLVVAGNETTRTALSHALMLLTEFPDQRALLLADMDNRLEGAVEEIVRYASPVVFMRRTLTRDYTMNGQDYRKDDKVVLYYYSANRDEDLFPDPERFDITRSPNPHVGFGAAGRHYCLGAHLARRELRVMLRELLTRVPDITAGEPDRLLSSFVNGIKHLPCDFSRLAT